MTFEDGEAEYELKGDLEEGRTVFICPAPEEVETIQLALGPKSYDLVRVKGNEDHCLVVNLNVGELEDFSARRRREPARYQIRLIKKS